MLSNYISKLVCLATLCAFLLQPQWSEGMTSCKVHQQHHLNFTKTHKPSSYAFDQSDNENESDEDAKFIAAELPSKINLIFPVLAENNSDAVYFHYKELHRLQERPIWLPCRKIVL